MSTDTEQSYEQVVRDAAEGIIDEAREQFAAGTTGEPLREWLLEHVWETCDGHQWVIYTHYAKRIVCESSNSGAYADNCGSDGAMEDGEIQWSRLAYAALEQDIYEYLAGPLSFDPNDPTAFFEDEADEDEDSDE